jgi:hypothetical protein
VVKKAINLDTRHFDTVSDARAFFSVMLNRYPLGARVSDEDARDLAALLKRHSGVAEKTGVGLDHFEVRAPPPDSPPFSDRCFWVVRTDGSSIDFSIGHCLK